MLRLLTALRNNIASEENSKSFGNMIIRCFLGFGIGSKTLNIDEV